MSAFGGRGGDAHDDELLKELMAISNKSNRRFDDDDILPSVTVTDEAIEVVKDSSEGAAVVDARAERPSAASMGSFATAPDDFPDQNTVAINAAPQEEMADGWESDINVSMDTSVDFHQANTFQGKNGGAAEDAELLAELRAISNKSNRFDEQTAEGGNADCKEGGKPEKQLVTINTDAEINKHDTGTALAITTTPNGSTNVEVAISDEAGQFQSNALPKTFTGDRGGSAEDEELLAELRAISNKSSDRFDGEEGSGADGSNSNEENFMVEEKGEPKKSTVKRPLPPWKKKKIKQSVSDENVVIAAPPTSSVASSEPNHGKFQSSDMPKTFKGDRGGSAEDADLLAELRAISNKGPNRFNDEDAEQNNNNDSIANVHDSHAQESNKQEENFLVEKKSPPPAKKSPLRMLKPWQKKKKQPVSDDVDVVVPSPNAAIAEGESKDDIVAKPEEGKFQSNDMPKTFKGDRGGAAEDADLLAELRAISNKGSNRFNDDGDAAQGAANLDSGATPHDNNTVDSGNNQEENSLVEKKAPAPAKKSPLRMLKPWQKKKKQTVSDDVDVAVAAPPPSAMDPFANAMVQDKTDPSAPEPEAKTSDGPNHGKFQSNDMPKTFKGDRGGAAEDADLLAELRAISKKGSSRFDDGDVTPQGNSNNDDANALKEKKVDDKQADDDASRDFKPLKPWQKKMCKQSVSNDVDVVVAAPPSPTVAVAGSSIDDEAAATFQSNNDLPKAFKGDQGGAAEDPSRLAELKAITNSGNEIHTVDRANSTEEEASFGHFQSNDNMPKTFKGDRGGSAEDAGLLAELRAITNSSRFHAIDANLKDNSVEDVESFASKNVTDSPKSLPPWKKKQISQSTSNPGVDIVTAAPKSVATESIDAVKESAEIGQHSFKFQSNLPKTFKGDRGGMAEDADLLAELRAISNKTTPNRFDDADETLNEQVPAGNNFDDISVKKADDAPKPPPKKAESKSSRPLPPWKRKGPQQKIDNKNSDIVVISESAPSRKTHVACPFDEKSPGNGPYDEAEAPGKSASTVSSDIPDTVPGSSKSGFNPVVPNTFKGDRGGAAEDADLLAELRAISNRFVEGDVDVKNQDAHTSNQLSESKPSTIDTTSSTSSRPPQPTHVSAASESSSTAKKPDDMLAYDVPPGSTPSQAVEINVTLDSLEESLNSSNWQLRKESYSFLHQRLESALSNAKPSNQLDEEEVFPKFESTVCKALNEKMAGGHDSALALAIMFTDSCQGACSEDCLKNIVTALLKGSAYSSSRKPTMLLAEDLVLKVIEVSPENSSSIQTTMDLLLQHGVKSKKPKVVLFTSELILRCLLEFGVGVFPVPTLSSISELLLSNSNNKVREVGLNTIAEICRALGSKSHLQSVVDKMKPAQQSQLDSLLESNPAPSQPIRQLLCRQGRSAEVQSPEAILAEMKRKEEEDKKKNFAARPAVNLFQVLPQTSYKEKIKLDKWSEKTAALDDLIKAGGEKPYKLAQPSSAINYVPLIRELTQLLGHTHFAVVSKALEALGMLAEGVGEDMSPQFRPLIPTLVGLFKDKKVLKAVASCLDSMFGYVFSFEHLLDSKDSLPSLMDEKKQKNALVRVSVLEFLGRCVSTNLGQGTRGQLTPEYARELCKLASMKLQDSDAATRKAASGILLSLLKSSDDAVVLIAKESTSSLEASNPRVFKSLQQALNGSSSSNANASTRPTTAPSKPALRKAVSARPKTAGATKQSVNAQASSPENTNTDDAIALPTLDEAVDKLSAFAIPKWSDDIDNDGVLAGIRSTTWQKRMGAINQLTGFIQENNADATLQFVPALFVLVKESTSSFKESNFNVAKSILLLFNTLFADVFAKLTRAPESYLYVPAAKIATEKIFDKKLSEASISCLNSLCIVKDPQRVISLTIKYVSDIKSPLAHEALLSWFKAFCIDFGVPSLSESIQDILTWILSECENNSVKVKNAALDVLGELHTQLGPALEPFVKSKSPSSGTLTSIEKVFATTTHDPAGNAVERKLRCITVSASSKTSSSGSGRGQGNLLSVPATDLVAALNGDCLSRMGTTDGKNSWKLRKEAMDEVVQEANKCSGLLSTDGKAYATLKEVMVALRSRMNDSQSNLKPLAANAMESILSRVDEPSQAKFGKVVFPALVSAAMADMKKTMRDASLSAIVAGTKRPEQEGSLINSSSLDALIVSLQSELSDAAIKSAGLPDVLASLIELLQSLCAQTDDPKKISTHLQLSKIIVESLLSSKAGTRAAAEKLYYECFKNALIPGETFNGIVGKLLPAQQRTIRSVIPKLSEEEKAVAESLKRERPRSSVQASRSASQKFLRASTSRPSTASPRLPKESVVITESIQTSNDENNPLAMTKVDPILKRQRLSILGKGDLWPDFPDEPSNEATQQALRKSWSQLIQSSTVQSLLPKNGTSSMECYIGGCDLIMKSISHSRAINDSTTIIEQLDLILKWASCALSSRDHTVGLRSLLATILALFERLHELSYTMNDAEALILLPALLDRAGTVKTPFQDQFLKILSFITEENVYPTKQYGSLVCVKVLDKSPRSKSRSLAANQIEACVKTAALAAIGKKGLIVLSKALSAENLVDNRVAYLSLFELIVSKLDGDLEKLLKLCGTSLSDNGKGMVTDRCIKANQSNATKQLPSSRLLTPSRTTRYSEMSPRVDIPRPGSSRFSEMSPRLEVLRTNSTRQMSPRVDANPGTPTLAMSKSAAATASLKERLQRSSQSKNSSLLPPGSSIQTQLPVPPVPQSPVSKFLQDISFMIQQADPSSTNNDLAAKVKQSIEQMSNFLVTDPTALDADSYDDCLKSYARVLEFAFFECSKLPIALIETTANALVLLVKLSKYMATVSSECLVIVIGKIISSLLDSRLDNGSTEKLLTKSINKLALRFATTSPRDTSLSALLSLQRTAVSLDENDPTFSLKRPRVIEKLLVKVISSEQDANPESPFSNINLEAVLPPFEDCLDAINSAKNSRPGRDSLLKPANDMTKFLFTELVKAKKELVRETMDRLGLRNEAMRALLNSIEKDIGSKGSTLADLINSVGKSVGEERATAVAKLSAIKQSDPELFQSHMLHLSTPFQEFIAELLDKYNKKVAVDPPAVEEQTESNSSLPASSLTRSDSRNSFSDLKARIDALKKRNNGDGE